MWSLSTFHHNALLKNLVEILMKIAINSDVVDCIDWDRQSLIVR